MCEVDIPAFCPHWLKHSQAAPGALAQYVVDELRRLDADSAPMLRAVLTHPDDRIQTLALAALDPAFLAISCIWLINGWFQSFGAPGMVKINAAWFHRTERGTFAGIFGFMIQLGQVAINNLAPVLLAGFTLGAWVVADGGYTAGHRFGLGELIGLT